jgi:hypothetical protein
MGLDNYPHLYPCRSRGTAVVVGDDDERIDCVATAEAGGCPWKNDYEASGLPPGGRAVGMFGTDCWYRGKWGNHLLEETGISSDGGEGFYGDSSDGTYKSPASCVKLADEIDAVTEGKQMLTDSNDDDILIDLRYASWYLRWAAENCGGLNCWY